MDHETMMRAQLRSMGLGHLADFITETVTDVAATAAAPFAFERDRVKTQATVLQLLSVVSRFRRFLTSKFATAEALAIDESRRTPPELLELCAIVLQLTVSPYTLAAAEARIELLSDPEDERAMRRLVEITVQSMRPVELTAYNAAKASPRMVGYLATPSGPADWREWVVLHLQAQAAGEAAAFLLAVVEHVWKSDVQSRREFRSEQELAAILIAVYIGGAGFALAAEDGETGRTTAADIPRDLRAALGGLIRDFAGRPAWSAAVTQHLHLAPPNSIYHRAAAALVEAAQAVRPGATAADTNPPPEKGRRRVGRRWGR